MTVRSESTTDHFSAASTAIHEHRLYSAAGKVGRFTLHLLEMVLAMMVGMVSLNGLDLLTPDYSRYSVVFDYGTNPFDIAMGLAMTVPMVAWMLMRGHGRRHSVEMALAMFAPIVPILALRLLGAEAELPWLDDASHPATFLGMLVAMLYRHDHFTGKASHAADAEHHRHA